MLDLSTVRFTPSALVPLFILVDIRRDSTTAIQSHATNVVEHPDLVAQRILRFTKSVGRERVIAATDCGLGGRVHPMVAWAKLEALAQGAALASKQLWR